MESTETKICSQLIQMAGVMLPLSNVKWSTGAAGMDSVVRLLIQYYMCLANLTKHLIERHATVAVKFRETR